MEDFIFDNIGKIIFVVFVVLISLAPVLSEYECSAKTEGIGLNHDWSFFGGCRVEYEQGKWIPLERYRVID